METEKRIIGRCPLCGGNVVKTCKGYRCEHNIGEQPSCVLNINGIIGNRKMNERTGTKTQALCAVRISFLDIPEENTLHYLSGKVIKLKDPQIVKQFDALDKNKEGATSWQT